MPGLLPIQVSRSPRPGSLLPEAAILTARSPGEGPGHSRSQGRTQGPGQGREAAGAHRGPAGGRRGLPDPLHCPGSLPLPEAAAILTMMERSTLILAPAAAGGGDPHGQEPRRGPRTEPEPGKGPKGPGQGREAAGVA